MKTEAFYRCLDLFISWKQATGQTLQFLEETKFPELENKYVTPFTRELGENLVLMPTVDQKSDVVIFYIGQLATTARIRQEYENIAFEYLFDGYPVFYKYGSTNQGDSRDPNVTAHYLYILLFNEIQIFCNIYHLPFRAICKDRFFFIKAINLEQTEIYELGRNFYAEQNENDGRSLPAIRPVLVPEVIPRVFDILKDFFTSDQQDALLKLLSSGGEVRKPLLFLDNGTKLADSFKQLIESNAIKGCQKKELESWIRRNFRYRYRDLEKEFTPRYLSDIISSSDDRCKNPIINVKREKPNGNHIIIKL